MKKQYAAIDIAKYISAILVVCIHTYPFYELSQTFNMYWIQTVCRQAVPFFFVCSGFFFFRKDFSDREASLDHLIHFEKRLLKIYGIWTVIYLPYTIYDYSRAGFRFYHIVSYLRDVLLNGSYYHLWFLPALMLAVAMVWGLLNQFGSRQTYRITLILYVIGYLINVYTPIWESLPGISLLFGFFTKLLVTSRNGIFFAPLYVAMGYLLAHTNRLPRRTSGLGWLLSFVLMGLEVFLYDKLGLLRDLTSMYLFLIPVCYFMTNFLLASHRYYKPAYLNLRHESLLIYTSHILFAKIWLALLPDAHLVVFFLTMACAQALASLVVRYKEQYPLLEHLL
ncbi:MAG: acyltransferase family protein [Erysipelotrichaceae bacterium]|nr:acyltransferase family protein [Erysipelotrichaceae bacterium]